MELHPEDPSGRLQVARLCLRVGIDGVDERADAVGCGDKLTYQLKPLRRDADDAY
jgi:hypothetical protein